MRIYVSIYVTLLMAIFLGGSVFATTIDTRSIEFKSGHPLVGENMETSVKLPRSDEYQLLRNNLDIFKNLPGYKVEVVGYTDSNECSRQKCIELSLRRAQLAYDWLIAQGVTPDRLIGPKAQGAEAPIDVNTEDGGRQRNRRTEFHLVAPDDEAAGS